MSDKVYISNIVVAWTPERQRELLAEVLARLHVPTYEDALGPSARKRKSGDDLKERAEMLRPTQRRDNETIHAASPCTFAWNPIDLVAALGAAWSRRASVIFHDTGLTLTPQATAQDVHEAVQAHIKARADAQTALGRERGWQRSKANKEAKTLAGIELIRADWPLKTYTTPQLKERSGIKSYGTIVKYLGKRPEARWRQEIADKANAARLARREAKK